MHAIMEVASNRSDGHFTLCSTWSKEALDGDPPVTCFSCLEFLRSVEFLEDSISEALKDHIGKPLTPERSKAVYDTLQKARERLKTR